MKVLHVIPSISPARGGPSLAVLDLVKAIQKSNIDVEIATTNDDGVNLLDIPLNQHLFYQGIPIYFFEKNFLSFAPLKEFTISIPFTKWLWENICHYDLIHVHALFSYTCTVTMIIANYYHVPYILTPHGLLCHWSLQQARLKKRLYLNLIEYYNLNQAKAIHFTAQQEEEEVKSLKLSPKTVEIPLGIEPVTKIKDASNKLRHWLEIPQNIPIILFLSRLHTKKGLDYLISALSKLHYQDFVFVLAGSGDSEYEAELARLLQKNNLGGRTYKLGFVEGEKKNICLQGADLYALTSHSENFGVAVLEALASGTPALVTKGVALSDLVKEQNLGWVVDLEIEAIANSIQEFLDNPDMAKQKGDRAAKYVAENYAWDKIALDLKSIYENILLS